MAQLERLTVFPVKGLEGTTLKAATVLEGGTLEYDRELALFDAEGTIVNGKQTDRVHELSTEFDPASGVVWIERRSGDGEDDESWRFDVETERERAAEWFSDFLDADLTLRRDSSLGFVDRREMGPSVISTATLETVASWFDELTVDSVRRRLRANIEVSGVPAFWEDRFVGENAPTFTIGDVRFEGVTPCARCVVPQRDPDTGEPTPQFRERFVTKRRETFPEWADEAAFDHHYTLMLISRVPESDRGRTLRIGDPVEVED